MWNRYFFVPVATAAAVLCVVPADGARKTNKHLDAKRVAEIAAALPEKPQGPGKPISDRQFWAEFSQHPEMKQAVEQARAMAKEPLPELPDELYLEFTRNGNRRNYEQAVGARKKRLTPLVLAECVTNNGEFMSALEQLIQALCDQKSWVLPAHDKRLTNFNNTQITIDLVSAHLAWELAMADYLLGEKLNGPTREMLRREVNRRVVLPFQAMIRGERKDDVWLARRNNWNPVCFAGVTGAGMILLESQTDRAEFIAAAEKAQRLFLDGFTKDGYCSEGVGYWNYGYGDYAIMAVNFREATGGLVDLFSLPGAAEAAAYGARIEIVPGVVPAFSDCRLGTQPSDPLMRLLNKVYGWSLPKYAGNELAGGTLGSLQSALLYFDAYHNPTTPVAGVKVSGGMEIRTQFEDAGVFIGRPPGVDGDTLAVAYKGGHNQEQHNHNDIGSYVVVAGGKPVLLDPGTEFYTKRSFGPQRYESKLLNSYGHPVPVVAGKLQKTGPDAQGVVLEKHFSETTDTVVLDMTSAYDVPQLVKLTRKFEYGRENGGLFIVTDTVEFSEPSTFETALISLEDFQMNEKGNVGVVSNGKARAGVSIRATSGFTTSQEVIEENAPAKPRRLAVRLAEPVMRAEIVTRVLPLK